MPCLILHTWEHLHRIWRHCLSSSPI